MGAEQVAAWVSVTGLLHCGDDLIRMFLPTEE